MLNVKDLTDDELRELAGRARQELSDREGAAYHAENARHVGGCFVTKNCYSGAEKKSDYWNMYSMVLSLSDGSGVNVLQFQTDRFGDFWCQKTHSYVHLLGKKISRGQWGKAAAKAISKAASSILVSVEICD